MSWVDIIDTARLIGFWTLIGLTSVWLAWQFMTGELEEED